MKKTPMLPNPMHLVETIDEILVSDRQRKFAGEAFADRVNAVFVDLYGRRPCLFVSVARTSGRRRYWLALEGVGCLEVQPPVARTWFSAYSDDRDP